MSLTPEQLELLKESSTNPAAYHTLLHLIADVEQRAIARTRLEMTGQATTEAVETHPQDVQVSAADLAAKVTGILPDIIYIFDVVARRNVYVNGASQDILGYSPDEIQALGSSLAATLVHPDDLRDLRQRSAAGKSNKLLANGFPVVAWEARFQHRSGEWRWLSIREREFELNPDGIVRTIFGIAQDVTQRKQIEDALIESETRYREMIERIPAAIIIVDTETSSVTYRNQAASDLLEETPDFTVLDALKLLYEHYMPVLDERFHQVIQGYPVPPREYHLQLPSGRARYVTSQSTPITYEGGRALMIVLVDTTERRQMEKERVERERLEASLQKEQELNALKSSMMLRISHEFRTPLSVIQLASETINRYATRLTPQKRQELVHRIATQIQQLVGMLEEMAFIVKNQSAPLMPHTMRFNLIELCYEIINRIHDSVLMRSPIHFSAEDTYIVLADPKLIQMLLLHLLTNAVKFSTNGSPVQFSIRAYDSMVEMRVADEGIGISAGDQQRIFEPFFRGGNISEISGMGLGLSIALEIVKAHGGTLQVESTLNQGSVFTVALPILADV